MFEFTLSRFHSHTYLVELVKNLGAGEVQSLIDTFKTNALQLLLPNYLTNEIKT